MISKSPPVLISIPRCSFLTDTRQWDAFRFTPTTVLRLCIRQFCVICSFVLPILFLPSFISAKNHPGELTFVDVQEAVGIDFTHNIDFNACPSVPAGSGSAWADYDNDGDIDLFITNQAEPSGLFRNDGDTNGDGLPDFTDVAPDLGIDETGQVSFGVMFIDYDNDGDQDLYITHLGGNTLYQNRLMETGALEFEDVTMLAGIGDDDRCLTASWGDYDQDGWLDLYLAKHFDCLPDIEDSRDALFKNNGDGTFINVSQYLCADGTLQCQQLNESHAFNAGWFDYDNDDDPDLYVVSDLFVSGILNILWRNDGPDGSGGWAFTDVSEESGTSPSINSFGLGMGDYDNDGWSDIALTSQGGFLLRNAGDGTFDDVSDEAGVRFAGWDPPVSWGPTFLDYDNDGWLDLSLVCGMISSLPILQPDILFRNNHDGTFTDVSVEAGIDDPRRGRNASVCDFNQDGFVDFLVGNLGLPIDLYYNQGRTLGNTNHWLTVTAEGGPGVNRDAFGTRFYLTTPDGITQMREILTGQTSGGGDYRAAYFGLGQHTTGTLTIRWPNGVVDSLGSVGADQRVHIPGPTSVPAPDPTPSQFQLKQNYPNPFNPSTTIDYTLREHSNVTLKIYNLLGQPVATLVDESQTAGHKSVVWNGRNEMGANVASGIYIYRIKAGSFVQTKRMLLLK